MFNLSDKKHSDHRIKAPHLDINLSIECKDTTNLEITFQPLFHHLIKAKNKKKWRINLILAGQKKSNCCRTFHFHFIVYSIATSPG